MRRTRINMNPQQQLGATTKGMLIAIFAIAFLVLAFRYRIGTLSVEPWQDQVFRGVMLIYFNLMLVLIVPSLAAWINAQDFMIQENAESSHPVWFEYLFLLFAVLFIFLQAKAIITGIMPEVRRYGAGQDFNSMLHTASYWSNVMAGYFLTLFVSTVYWQARLIRIERTR
ncbi:MAG: hypothetical protein DHS20C12_28870 [Pseudohongiella sp.]|nr:MAG: hypothetical protein DHS20C12_28870 [Pseudohongiella sp.]